MRIEDVMKMARRSQFNDLLCVGWIVMRFVFSVSISLLNYATFDK